MPATMAICARFAPATFLDRNTRNGSSGFAAVRCRTTNPASSATATAPRPSVRSEPKPWCSAFTIV